MQYNTGRNVIIGNSAAGLSALETLRKNDSNCEITVISREKGPAYSLVLLPYLIHGKMNKVSIQITTEEYYEKLGAKSIFGKEAIGIDAKNHYILLDDESRISFDNLIICTGASPGRLDIEGCDMIRAKSLRSLEDALELRAMLQTAKKLMLIGAGLINLKLISLLRDEGFEFTVVEMADRVLVSMVDQTTSEIVEKRIQESGIRLYNNSTLTKIRREKDGKLFSVLNNGIEIETDAVIYNTGISPNVGFLRGSGIFVNRGIIIDRYAKTNIPNIYAAGDVVTAQERGSGRYMTIGNWVNAVEQGKIAAYSILGRNREYEGCVNINITDLFGLTIASFGDFNGISEKSDKIIWSDLERQYYRKLVMIGNEIIGGVLVNEKRTTGIYKSLLGKSLSNSQLSSLKKNFGNSMLVHLINYSKRKGPTNV